MNLRKMKLRATKRYKASSFRIGVRDSFHRHYRTLARLLGEAHQPLFKSAVNG